MMKYMNASVSKPSKLLLADVQRVARFILLYHNLVRQFFRVCSVKENECTNLFTS
jgi:hypothetical protein